MTLWEVEGIRCEQGCPGTYTFVVIAPSLERYFYSENESTSRTMLCLYCARPLPIPPDPESGMTAIVARPPATDYLTRGRLDILRKALDTLADVLEDERSTCDEDRHDIQEARARQHAALDSLAADLAQTFAMDDYEAANLRAGLLTLRQIGLDTGDWLGQLLNRLPVVEQAPNVAVYQQVERAERKLAPALARHAQTVEALRDFLYGRPCPVCGLDPLRHTADCEWCHDAAALAADTDSQQAVER